MPQHGAFFKPGLCLLLWLRRALQHQRQRGLEGEALLQIGAHRAIGFIGGILAVNHLRHPRKTFADLRFAQQAM